MNLRIVTIMSTFLLISACGGGSSASISSAGDGGQASSVTGTATVSWVMPSERTDNSPLPVSEIAGYKIYYGLSEAILDNSIQINDSSVNLYTINTLTVGNTYYFAVVVIDNAGIESSLSNIAQKTI